MDLNVNNTTMVKNEGEFNYELPYTPGTETMSSFPFQTSHPNQNTYIVTEIPQSQSQMYLEPIYSLNVDEEKEGRTIFNVAIESLAFVNDGALSEMQSNYNSVEENKNIPTYTIEQTSSQQLSQQQQQQQQQQPSLSSFANGKVEQNQSLYQQQHSTINDPTSEEMKLPTETNETQSQPTRSNKPTKQKQKQQRQANASATVTGASSSSSSSSSDKSTGNLSCTICSCKYSRKTDLKNHYLTHTGERPYQCDTCQKGYKTQSHLKAHQIIHSDFKPYKCKFCEKKFHSSWSHKRHVKIHGPASQTSSPDEKSFKCDFCDKEFDQPTELRVHVCTNKTENPAMENQPSNAHPQTNETLVQSNQNYPQNYMETNHNFTEQSLHPNAMDHSMTANATVQPIDQQNFTTNHSLVAANSMHSMLVTNNQNYGSNSGDTLHQNVAGPCLNESNGNFLSNTNDDQNCHGPPAPAPPAPPPPPPPPTLVQSELNKNNCVDVQRNFPANQQSTNFLSTSGPSNNNYLSESARIFTPADGIANTNAGYTTVDPNCPFVEPNREFTASFVQTNQGYNIHLVAPNQSSNHVQTMHHSANIVHAGNTFVINPNFSSNQQQQQQQQQPLQQQQQQQQQQQVNFQPCLIQMNENYNGNVLATTNQVNDNYAKTTVSLVQLDPNYTTKPMVQSNFNITPTPTPQTPELTVQGKKKTKQKAAKVIKPQERRHECGVCKKRFTKTSYLKVHMRMHASDKVQDCKVCHQKFTCTTTYTQHLQTHEKAKPHKCSHCGKSFSQASDLKRHETQHTAEKLHECEVCHNKYTRRSGLKVHMRKHNVVGGDGGVEAAGGGAGGGGVSVGVSVGVVVSVEKPFKCNRCDESFGTSPILKEHLLTHHNNNDSNSSSSNSVLSCNICHRSFASEFNLRKHNLQVHKIPDPNATHKCPHCEKAFVRLHDYNSHLRLHSGEKPYKCTICSQTYNTRQELRTHYNGHEAEKPFECQSCKKRFSKQGSLKLHERMHSSEKVLRCDICDRNFTTQQHLNKHTNRHVPPGEIEESADGKPKAFRCEQCRKCFCSEDSAIRCLKKHSTVMADSQPAIPIAINIEASNHFAESINAVVNHQPQQTIKKENLSAPADVYKCSICLQSFKSKELLDKCLQLHGCLDQVQEFITLKNVVKPERTEEPDPDELNYTTITTNPTINNSHQHHYHPTITYLTSSTSYNTTTEQAAATMNNYNNTTSSMPHAESTTTITMSATPQTTPTTATLIHQPKLDWATYQYNSLSSLSATSSSSQMLDGADMEQPVEDYSINSPSSTDVNYLNYLQFN